MAKNFWAKENTVKSFPQRPCLACGDAFSPENHWSERCKPCKAADRPKTKKIINKHFNGKNPLPLEKLRIRIVNGVKMPSVTTVLHPFGIDYPEHLLNQYAARGTLVHKQVEIFLRTGKWYPPESLPRKADHEKERDELFKALDSLTQGSLGLKTVDCNFRGFYKEFRKRFTFNNLEIESHNTKHAYCGRFDCHGTYKGQPAIIDFKTASDYNREKLESYFQQLSAYANTDGMEEIKYLVVIPLSPRSENGYEAPLVSTKVKSHFKSFLEKRKEFKKLYGI